MPALMPPETFFAALVWLDRRPLSDHIEPYRARIFRDVLSAVDATGRLRYNLAVIGRAKKNWKSADLVLAAQPPCTGC